MHQYALFLIKTCAEIIGESITSGGCLFRMRQSGIVASMRHSNNSLTNTRCLSLSDKGSSGQWPRRSNQASTPAETAVDADLVPSDLLNTSAPILDVRLARLPYPPTAPVPLPTPPRGLRLLLRRVSSSRILLSLALIARRAAIVEFRNVTVTA